MDESTGDRRIERFGWTDWLNQRWLKLPLLALQDIGPATQTLGAILSISRRETFTSLRKIALRARLPVPTAKKHIAKLHEAGWITNLGRERSPAGYLRRTATLKVTKKTIAGISDGTRYAGLPWWACCRIRRVGHLPWHAKVVLAVAVSRLMALNKAVQDQDGCGADADDLQGSIENFGGDDRFGFSLSRLQRETALSRESVVHGKQWLHRHKIIICQKRRGSDGGRESDLLVPNWDFVVVQTLSADETRFSLDFDG